MRLIPKAAATCRLTLPKRCHLNLLRSLRTSLRKRCHLNLLQHAIRLEALAEVRAFLQVHWKNPAPKAPSFSSISRPSAPEKVPPYSRSSGRGKVLRDKGATLFQKLRAGRGLRRGDVGALGGRDKASERSRGPLRARRRPAGERLRAASSLSGDTPAMLKRRF